MMFLYEHFEYDFEETPLFCFHIPSFLLQNQQTQIAYSDIRIISEIRKTNSTDLLHTIPGLKSNTTRHHFFFRQENANIIENIVHFRWFTNVIRILSNKFTWIPAPINWKITLAQVMSIQVLRPTWNYFQSRHFRRQVQFLRFQFAHFQIHFNILASNPTKSGRAAIRIPKMFEKVEIEAKTSFRSFLQIFEILNYPERRSVIDQKVSISLEKHRFPERIRFALFRTTKTRRR